MGTAPIQTPTPVPVRTLPLMQGGDGKLLNQFNYPWLKWFQTQAAPPILVTAASSARASAVASTYPAGSLYYETDLGLYYIQNAGQWTYFSGILKVAQANIPQSLGTNDAGLLLYVTDFAHLLQWTGSGWQWGPGDSGSDYIVAFVNGPSPITGWQACDGSANIPRLQSDGSLGFSTVPNIAGSFYRQ